MHAYLIGKLNTDLHEKTVNIEDNKWPRDLQAGLHFDVSPRGTTPKRRVDDDEMEDDAPEKRQRPRTPAISYCTDADLVGSDMDDGTLDGLRGIDQKIFSAAILGVDTTEV